MRSTRAVVHARLRPARQHNRRWRKARSSCIATAPQKGVIERASGLQYRILKEGIGRSPGPHDIVVANYTGTLVDGTKFDSTYDRGQPATFGVDRVIPGWSEALQLMKEGSVWELFIPSDPACGPKGA